MNHHGSMDKRVLERRKIGERGASLVEYALLVALIAVVCIVAVTFLGKSASGKIGTAGTAIKNPQYTCVSYHGGAGYQILDSNGSAVASGPQDCSYAQQMYPQYFG